MHLAAKIVAAIAIVLVGLTVGPASADPRGGGRGRGNHSRSWGNHSRSRGSSRSWGYRHHRPSDPLGGFWGGVVGGWLGSQFSNDREDDVVDELEPWSEGWYAYCQRKYRSFDPETGTYLSYSGERRLCK
jgi:hypothetical protein